MSCLFPHSFIDFLRSEDLPAVGERDTHAVTNRVRIFALERERQSKRLQHARPLVFPTKTIPLAT
jgi:hypothetical protein